jgi:hypothetical protein
MGGLGGLTDSRYYDKLSDRHGQSGGNYAKRNPHERKIKLKTNTTETAAGTDMPDFNKTSLDSLRCELTTPIIFGFFEFLRALMLWFETKGKELLEQSDPLTFEQWEELYENSWLLYTRLGRAGGAVTKLHLRVLRKGIASLLHWVQTTYIGGIHDLKTDKGNELNRILGHWHARIENDIRVGGAFGLQSHFCTKEESWELVESMVPVAQALKSDAWLRDIAMDRYAGDDKLSFDLFIKAHKNW